MKPSSYYSLEEALMLKEPNNILTQVLVNFVVNLKPATRNLRYSCGSTVWCESWSDLTLFPWR